MCREGEMHVSAQQALIDAISTAIMENNNNFKISFESASPLQYFQPD
jgi:hypothetical protein